MVLRLLRKGKRTVVVADCIHGGCKTAEQMELGVGIRQGVVTNAQRRHRVHRRIRIHDRRRGIGLDLYDVVRIDQVAAQICQRVILSVGLTAVVLAPFLRREAPAVVHIRTHGCQRLTNEGHRLEASEGEGRILIGINTVGGSRRRIHVARAVLVRQTRHSRNRLDGKVVGQILGIEHDTGLRNAVLQRSVIIRLRLGVADTLTACTLLPVLGATADLGNDVFTLICDLRRPSAVFKVNGGIPLMHGNKAVQEQHKTVLHVILVIRVKVAILNRIQQLFALCLLCGNAILLCLPVRLRLHDGSLVCRGLCLVAHLNDRLVRNRANLCALLAVFNQADLVHAHDIRELILQMLRLRQRTVVRTDGIYGCGEAPEHLEGSVHLLQREEVLMSGSFLLGENAELLTVAVVHHGLHAVNHERKLGGDVSQTLAALYDTVHRHIRRRRQGFIPKLAGTVVSGNTVRAEGENRIRECECIRNLIPGICVVVDTQTHRKTGVSAHALMPEDRGHEECQLQAADGENGAPTGVKPPEASAVRLVGVRDDHVILARNIVRFEGCLYREIPVVQHTRGKPDTHLRLVGLIGRNGRDAVRNTAVLSLFPLDFIRGDQSRLHGRIKF